MGRINWTTEERVRIAGQSMACAITAQGNNPQVVGLRLDSPVRLLLKRALWPLLKMRNDLLVDGFIESEIGGLIRKYLRQDSVFLEIGCGDMSLSRFLPAPMWYNGLDIRLSQFHVERVLRSRRHTNLALASVTRIPVESNVVTLLVCTETLEHVRAIDDAVNEMHRVATPHSFLICSIPNNYCLKYRRKGPHPDHVNSWTFQKFANFMSEHGFHMVEGYMKGYWIPLPTHLFKTSYQLPLSCRDEQRNTNFFYVFETRKGGLGSALP